MYTLEVICIKYRSNIFNYRSIYNFAECKVFRFVTRCNTIVLGERETPSLNPRCFQFTNDVCNAGQDLQSALI